MSNTRAVRYTDADNPAGPVTTVVQVPVVDQKALHARVPQDLALWLSTVGYSSPTERPDVDRVFEDRRVQLLRGGSDRERFSILAGHQVAGGGAEGYVLYVSPVDMLGDKNYYGKLGKLEHVWKIRELEHPAPRKEARNQSADDAGRLARMTLQAATEVALTAREILHSYALRVLGAPYVAGLLGWYLWVQLVDPPVEPRSAWPSIHPHSAGTDRVFRTAAQLINQKLNRTERMAFEITDYFQPASTGHAARRQYLKNRQIPVSSSASDDTVGMQYVNARADVMRQAHAVGQTQRPVLMLEQEYAGIQTMALYTVKAYGYESFTERSWFRPAEWPRLRGHMLVLCHQLYTLQARYGFVHGDLHPSNICMRDVRNQWVHGLLARDTVPPEYAGLWMPDTGAQGGFQPRQLDIANDLAYLLPRLIDFGRTSLNVEQPDVRAALNLDPHNNVEQFLKQQATPYLYGYSRTTDLRRVGVLLAVGIFTALQIMFSTSEIRAKFAASLSSMPVRRLRSGNVEGGNAAQQQLLLKVQVLQTYFDERAVRMVMALVSVPNAWFELALSKPNANAARHDVHKSSTLELFVKRMLVTQSALRMLHKVLTTRSISDLNIRHLNFLTNTQAVGNALQIMLEVRDDLGPYTRLVYEQLKAEKPSELGQHMQQQRQQQQRPTAPGHAINVNLNLAAPTIERDDPRLPENVIRWSVMTSQ